MHLHCHRPLESVDQPLLAQRHCHLQKKRRVSAGQWTRGRGYKDRTKRYSPCPNAATTARGLPCSPLALPTVAGCGARCRVTATGKPWYVVGEKETLSHSVGVKAGVTGLQVDGWKCSQLPAEELRLEHGDEHEHERWDQSSRSCRKLRSDRGSVQPTHFAGPLHITTGSISPSAQGLEPNMCPSPGQMLKARAVLLPCPGITCSPAARFVEALSLVAPQQHPWQEAHSTLVPMT